MGGGERAGGAAPGVGGAAAFARRFLDAQAPVWETARAERARGRKASHWMWFVFPQLKGLCRSGTAPFHGLDGPEAARAYLAHPVLGARLAEAAGLMLRHAGTRAEAILGAVDALKLRTSMTLFAALPGAPPVFGRVLDAFHDGPRARTRAMLGPRAPSRATPGEGRG